MSIWWIILIAIAFILLLGPIMYGFAKLNHVNPFIFEEEHPEDDENSLMIVMVLRPLFGPLWLEKKIIDWLKTKFSKRI